MGKRTGIEWCHHTFNIAWGCTMVSPGCTHCYAKTVAERFGFDVWGQYKPRRVMSPPYWDEPLKWNAAAVKAGERRRVFCSSMADVFEAHPTIATERARLWTLIRKTPQLDWLLLTKRPERIAANLPNDWGEGYPNVWLGTSVESEAYLPRITYLLTVPAALHFLSCEPLLGPLTLAPFHNTPAFTHRIGWVIVGGESGPKARPMTLKWAKHLMAECSVYGIPFFLKQLGGHPKKRDHEEAVLDDRRFVEVPEVRHAVAR